MRSGAVRFFLTCALAWALPGVSVEQAAATEAPADAAPVDTPVDTGGSLTGTGQDSATGGDADGVESEVAPIEIDAETTGLKEAPPKIGANDDVASSWDIRWDHGIQFELNQKVLFPGHQYFPWRVRDYRKLNGRMGFKIHVDAAAFSARGEIEDIPDDIQLRRARIYTLGNTFFLSPLDFKIEFGYSGQSFFFNDGYVRWNEVNYLSTIQAGQFKSPMSLEMMGSSGITVFMERGSPVTAFAPGSRLGLQIGGPFIDERVTLIAGMYANVSDLDVGDATESAAGPIARLTWSPIRKEQDGQRDVLHLGASASFTDSRDNAFQYRSRPESYLAPYLVDTGDIDGDYSNLYGLELAAIRGPWTFQAELLHSYVARSDEAAVRFFGTYAYLSYFITGESRPYNSNKGILSRIRTKKTFSFREKTWGAWEAAARASYLDLSDEDVRGGRMRDLSAGINWYLNRDDRLMFNCVYSDVNDTPESGQLLTFEMRMQIEY